MSARGVFSFASGYGYNDHGQGHPGSRCTPAPSIRKRHLVRPQITCGTHALALALAANLRPGRRAAFSPVGKPYDTLEEVIGIRANQKVPWQSTGSPTARWSCLEDGYFDYPAIRAALNERTKAGDDPALQGLSDTSQLFRGEDRRADRLYQRRSSRM